MRRMKAIARFGLALALFGATASAAPGLSPASRSEIEGLLSELARSNCQFNRNGTWYGAEEASAHLRKKLEYLDGKGALHSADDFIALAGTRSSRSGTAYAVRCGEETPQASSEWLGRQLGEMRRGATPDTPHPPAP